VREKRLQYLVENAGYENCDVRRIGKHFFAKSHIVSIDIPGKTNLSSIELISDNAIKGSPNHCFAHQLSTKALTLSLMTVALKSVGHRDFACVVSTPAAK
jgi:hypothetical protein